ncbi:DUF1223 domain-containing protein [Photobacterium galatheae]|uniref:DUF1223 domain-containing protein n=2 Tax=Photobacterium galatheae TaxID=1654360 RepID=A0A066RNW5_9GAMM|nr:DUF1223 domain-containing protein [Photobacterium galatheae]KDM90791.1 hypothetical protein EA58_15510 [Photobacterium galatheae]MCM0149879.1 DUF1223 domain-containing protein [Photobacterium galatheae]
MILAAGLFAVSPFTLAQTWQHSGQPAQVIELFTSQGCSSCPPADHFTSSLKQQYQLWEAILPVVYHVDYWDHLGWKDTFSKPEYSLKQRLYHQYQVLSGVYTPGFVIDGKEWRGFFRGQPLPARQPQTADNLTLKRSGDTFQLEYKGKGRYVAHLVILAMNEKIQIRRGENAGKQLEYDHVVLSDARDVSESTWSFPKMDIPPNADAVAAWLTRENSFVPVQTVAGWLEQSVR